MPVFKKGERFKASNYRPVSLTFICSKLMVHVVVSQMIKHFDELGIWADCPHSFRKQRSCETQLIGLTQELHECLEEKVQVDMIVLDYSKVFDKVPHQRLMTKLWNYGIRGNTHTWIKSFLLGSTQSRGGGWGIGLGTSGVRRTAGRSTRPGALPFLLQLPPKCYQIKCAPLHRWLQDDLDSLENWENKWCMSFNAAKCNTIAITRKHKKILHPYTLHSQILDSVEKATYLGVELSGDLTWAAHINQTCDKGNKQLAFLRRNLRINNPC